MGSHRLYVASRNPASLTGPLLHHAPSIEGRANTVSERDAGLQLADDAYVFRSDES